MNFTTKLKAAIRKTYPDFNTLLLRRYPKFVYSRETNGDIDTIPVFHFHEVEPDTFEQKLVFLRDNGYKTINSSEWLKYQKFPVSERRNKVVLTFDDGHISLEKYAFPLLKKHECKAISFICPSLIPDNQEADTKDDRRVLCNWEEVRKMHNSGYVDFQSHSLSHDLVFCSSKLIDFFNPRFKSFYFGKQDAIAIVLKDDMDISLTNVSSYREQNSSEYYGTPIFALRPRIDTNIRFLSSKKKRDHLRNYVKARGGIRFFKRKGWRKTLRQEFFKFKDNELGKYLKDKQYQKHLADELHIAKEIIEHKLPGKKVQHFCPPWFKMTKKAMKTASSVGYVSAFLGEDAFQSGLPRRENDGIIKVPRLSSNYIFRLFGKGRKKLLDIITDRK